MCSMAESCKGMMRSIQVQLDMMMHVCIARTGLWGHTNPKNWKHGTEHCGTQLHQQGCWTARPGEQQGPGLMKHAV